MLVLGLNDSLHLEQTPWLSSHLVPGPYSSGRHQTKKQGGSPIRGPKGNWDGRGVLHRVWSGTGEEDTGLTATRFKFSTCLTITLHPAFPSFFPLVFCALM